MFYKRDLLAKQPPEAILQNFKAFFPWELRGFFRQLQIRKKKEKKEKDSK